MDTDETCPTLTFNTIGRHQSRLVRTRVASNQSPWLMKTQPGEIYTVPISHGEGRFLASEELVRQLAERGRLPPSMWTWRAIPPRIFTTIPTTLSGPLRESPPPTVVCSARWATVSGRPGLYRNVPGDYRHEALPRGGGVFPVRKEEPVIGFLLSRTLSYLQ